MRDVLTASHPPLSRPSAKINAAVNGSSIAMLSAPLTAGTTTSVRLSALTAQRPRRHQTADPEWTSSTGSGQFLAASATSATLSLVWDQSYRTDNIALRCMTSGIITVTADVFIKKCLSNLTQINSICVVLFFLRLQMS